MSEQGVGEESLSRIFLEGLTGAVFDFSQESIYIYKYINTSPIKHFALLLYLICLSHANSLD